MTRTYRKNVVRTVRTTASRFFAILAIVALGVGFLAGLLSATPDMRYSGDKYFDDTHLFDIRVLGTLGLTEEDLAAVRKIEGVSDAMPAYYTDVLMDIPGATGVVTRLHSLPLDQIEASDPQGYLNRLVVKEGRLPVKDNECVVLGGLSIGGMNISVGDTLTVNAQTKDVADSLNRTEFKVVGVVHNAYYFSIEREASSIGNGSLGTILYTGEQNFVSDVYSELFLSLKGTADMLSTDEEYTTAVDTVVKRIEDISGARSKLRYDSVLSEAKTKLADAEKEYADGEAEAAQKLGDAKKALDDGQAEIFKNEKTLEDAAKKIEQGKKELQANREALPGTLSESQKKLAAGQAALIDGKAAYTSGLAEYNQQLAQITNLKTMLGVAEQVVSTLQPMLTSAQEKLPALEQAIIPLKTAADTATAAYNAAQQAVTDAMALAGYTTEEEWLAADPQIAGVVIAARDTAKQTMATAVNAYTSAESAYQEAKSTVDTLAAKINEAQAQIDAGKPQIADGEAQLAAAKIKLDAANVQLIAAEKEIASGQTALSIAPGLAQLQLDLAGLQLDSAQAQTDDGSTKLEDAKTELADGQTTYEKEKKTAEEKLADGKAQLKKASDFIANLKTPEWYVLTRSENMSYASFTANVDRVEAIATVFPIFFFLVAALVALTTMTRMVDEERLQIGTMKALGFKKSSIMAKYILYALFATVLGCVLGLAVGFVLFPTVIWNAYTMMYTLPKMYCLFHLKYALIATGAALLCTMAATLNACHSTLSEVPAQLMLPRAPKAGKRILLERIPFMWKRLKFTHKVTARNLFLYKKRFVMTIIGIAGCTGLLVTGFGLHDSISDIVNRQFGKVFTYDLSITLKGDEIPTQMADILSDTNFVTGSMLSHQEKSDNTYGNETFTTYIMVPEDNTQFPNFVDLHERVSGKPVPFSQTGVVITEKMAERTGYSVGEEIPLENVDGKKSTFKVTGIVENYIENYVYMDAAVYAQHFGTPPKFEQVLVRMADNSADGRDALAQKLLEIDDAGSLSYVNDAKTTFSNMMTKIDTIVVVLILSAGLLAFVVLYNLTNINITERTKEIATIKVLGFRDKEVSKYVYRETIVLSIIGAAAGLMFGVFLHMFVMRTVEVDAVMFGRTIKPLSYIFSAALTLAFSLLVNLVMRKKLKKISMVESMKAPE